MRVGEAFVECTEKTGCPGIGPSGQGDNSACAGEGGYRKECTWQEHLRPANLLP
jgi:hypothetical protein